MKRLSNLCAMMIAIALGTIFGAPLQAQDREVPYWASISSEEVNMRVGPSRDYPIDWVYRRRGLPVKVVRVREGWRLVQDPDGAQGWIVSSLLSQKRTAIIIGDSAADMREFASAESTLRWRVAPGNVGALGRCETGWCELNIAGHTGWVEQARLWGPGAP